MGKQTKRNLYIPDVLISLYFITFNFNKFQTRVGVGWFISIYTKSSEALRNLKL